MSENGPGEITSIEITAGGKTATLTPPKVPDENERALAEIAEVNRRVDKAWEDWQEAKAVAAERKSIFDDTVTELRATIRSIDTPLPLFDRKPAQPEGENAWREVLLVEALQGVPSSILAKLAEAGLTTVGQMADFTQSERLVDVPGIGQAKAEQIEAALESFWARRAAAGQAVSAGEILDADFEVKA